MFVRLYRGEAHDLVQSILSDILGGMLLDLELEAGAATGAVRATAIDLDLRMSQYREYPAGLVGLCRRWRFMG